MNTAGDIKDVLELARNVAFGCGIVAALTERISHCLRKHRIPIAALLGVLTKPSPEWNIAISSQLPTPHGAWLLSAPLNFDFAKLSSSPSVREADEAEDRSYGDGDIAVNDHLRALANSDQEGLDLVRNISEALDKCSRLSRRRSSAGE